MPHGENLTILALVCSDMSKMRNKNRSFVFSAILWLLGILPLPVQRGTSKNKCCILS